MYKKALLILFGLLVLFSIGCSRRTRALFSDVCQSASAWMNPQCSDMGSPQDDGDFGDFGGIFGDESGDGDNNDDDGSGNSNGNGNNSNQNGNTNQGNQNNLSPRITNAVPDGNRIRVHFEDIGSGHWIGLYNQGQSRNSYLDWEYIRELSGTVYLDPPTRPKTYDIHVFQNGNSNTVASYTVTVPGSGGGSTGGTNGGSTGGTTSNGTASIQVSFNNQTQTYVVSFSGVTPHYQNWIGVYAKGDPNDGSHNLRYEYIHNMASGTLNFRAADLVTKPEYDFRLFYQNSYNLEASASIANQDSGTNGGGSGGGSGSGSGTQTACSRSSQTPIANRYAVVSTSRQNNRWSCRLVNHPNARIALQLDYGSNPQFRVGVGSGGAIKVLEDMRQQDSLLVKSYGHPNADPLIGWHLYSTTLKNPSASGDDRLFVSQVGRVGNLSPVNLETSGNGVCKIRLYSNVNVQRNSQNDSYFRMPVKMMTEISVVGPAIGAVVVKHHIVPGQLRKAGSLVSSAAFRLETNALFGGDVFNAILYSQGNSGFPYFWSGNLSPYNKSAATTSGYAAVMNYPSNASRGVAIVHGKKQGECGAYHRIRSANYNHVKHIVPGLETPPMPPKSLLTQTYVMLPRRHLLQTDTKSKLVELSSRVEAPAAYKPNEVPSALRGIYNRLK